MNLSKFLIVILGFSFLVACEPKSDLTPKLDQHPEEVEGGISSGGGGTLPTNPISTYEVYDIVSGAKRTLRMYFRSGDNVAPELVEQGSLDRFFVGEKNLSTVLEETDIEILEDRACRDAYNREVDASIFASRPHTICLSAHRVAPKLIKERASTEILALIVHELSHLLGATESEAVELQRRTAWAIKDVRHDLLWRETWDSVSEVERMKALIGSVRESYQKIQIKDLEKEIIEVSQAFSKLDLKLGAQFPLSMFDFRQGNYFEVQKLRLRLMEIFISSQVPEEGQQYLKEEYEKAFGQADEITVEEYRQNTGATHLKENIFQKEKIYKLYQVSDMEFFLEDLDKYLSGLRQLVAAIAYDSPIPRLDGFWNKQKENPWTYHLGKYEVLSQKCHGNYHKIRTYDIVALELVSDEVDKNKVKAKEIWSNGFATRPFYENAYDGGDVRVDGSDKMATRTTERGTRWYNSQSRGWSKITYSLTRFDDSFQLKIRNDELHHSMYEFKEYFNECELTLRKL